jgi:hypothetical protein
MVWVCLVVGLMTRSMFAGFSNWGSRKPSWGGESKRSDEKMCEGVNKYRGGLNPLAPLVNNVRDLPFYFLT